MSPLPAFALLENTLGKDTPDSFLFHDPKEQLLAYSPQDVLDALDAIQRHQQSGAYAVGYLTYEAGYALYPRLRPLHDADACSGPLLHFVVFAARTAFCAKDLDATLEQHGLSLDADDRVSLSDMMLDTDYRDYQRQLAEVQGALRRGESYQVNLTCGFDFHTTGSHAALYRKIRRFQPVLYSAFLPFDPVTVISASPELFFQKTGDKLRVKPMKGTISRSEDPHIDRQRKDSLAFDEKTKAENLIIVDLLRNDLSNVAKTGSVTVTKLFDVGTDDHLHHMSSIIDGRCDPAIRFKTLILGLFPCGSITGAPKVRTMELIHQIETQPRGVYTGAIGYVTPDNDMCLNVAIRTLALRTPAPGTPPLGTPAAGTLADPALRSVGRFGVGGGITIESDASEWEELLLKAKFLTSLQGSTVRLIECLRYQSGYRRLPEHLDRLTRSAQGLGWRIDPLHIEGRLESYASVCMNDEACYKVRFEVDRDGSLCELSHQQISTTAEPMRVKLYPHAIEGARVAWRYKTTLVATRGFYDKTLASLKGTGFSAHVFFNTEGVVTESEHWNVIVTYRGRRYTSPVAAGLLLGVHRQWLLDTGAVVEKPVTLDMLRNAEALHLCNSVRGEIPATLVMEKEAALPSGLPSELRP